MSRNPDWPHRHWPKTGPREAGLLEVGKRYVFDHVSGWIRFQGTLKSKEWVSEDDEWRLDWEDVVILSHGVDDGLWAWFVETEEDA